MYSIPMRKQQSTQHGRWLCTVKANTLEPSISLLNLAQVLKTLVQDAIITTL